MDQFPAKRFDTRQRAEKVWGIGRSELPERRRLQNENAPLENLIAEFELNTPILKPWRQSNACVRSGKA